LVNKVDYEYIYIILFLNKIDIFEKNIQYLNIKKIFPDYRGCKITEEAIGFISKLYVGNVQCPNRQIMICKTCASDTKQMSPIINNVLTNLYYIIKY